MKRVVLIVVALFSMNSLFAQAVPQLNFGLGFDNGGLLPIYVSYDFPVHNDVSIAPMFETDLNLDWVTIGARGDYYFDRLINLPADWDVYGGANLGMNILLGSRYSELDMGLQIGGRWRWNKKWALNLEVSGGVSHGAKLGVTVAI